ncbi:MAG: AGE family epimerase/isomerase [Proteobacteria bacterium]|nr:AGE family epimerase/isomerase [Pseudomonadota bacterium]
MAIAPESLEQARLASLRGRLREWLVEAAYPRWAAAGVDGAGGFAESLDAGGRDSGAARRARVAPRQLYAFALAPRLGFRAGTDRILRGGLAYLESRYRRPDGFYRTLVATDGRILDDAALLYDQAFVLLGLAAATAALGVEVGLEARAVALRERIATNWRLPGGGFRAGSGAADGLEANPHMHLLESCLAWAAVGQDPGWRAWADALVALALNRLIRPDSGALHESYAADATPASGLAGRRVEPGHQYEWAFLLLRAPVGDSAQRRRAALRLIDGAERHGVREGFAVNALLDGTAVYEGGARLWVQTERLRAGVEALRATGEARYLRQAGEAAAALWSYLRSDAPGLWFDRRDVDGRLEDSPAYASTFYHLVGAIAALGPEAPLY